MYTIKIVYKTGNSFGISTEEDNISVVWKDKELARAALQSIKEHKQYYDEIHSYWGSNPRDKDQIQNKYKNKEWYHSKYPELCLYVKLDDGSTTYINTFWTGYFESLISAHVVLDESGTDRDNYYA